MAVTGADPSSGYGEADFSDRHAGQSCRARVEIGLKFVEFQSEDVSRPTASGVQLRRRRASRFSKVSPSKSVAVSTSCDRSTPSKVLTLTTAYRVPSIIQVAIGNTPQVKQMWNCAVFVPN
jgi:hypothetical protein